MKVRTDFVTNSSSVSFVITMSPEMVKTHESAWGKYEPNEGCVAQALRERIEKDGTRVMLEDREIFTLTFKFGTDEIMDDESFGRAHHEIEPAAMKDADLWAYIYGQYILGGSIAKLRGFGATQVETY